MKQIHGIFAVTVTHFQENGEIDYAACAKHINWLIESGVHGLLPLGATGEFSALTLEERKAFAEFAMKEVAGRVPVIIGAVSTNVDVTLEVAKHAASIGADGVITAIQVMDNSETPNVGKKTMEPAFTDQFKGKSGSDGVDAVSGATISSTAVFKVVDAAMAAYQTVKGA